MLSLDLQRRKTDAPCGALTRHRCRSCREDLVLVRRHISPDRLGPRMTTEFYQCRACDSGYALNLAGGTWKTWAADEA